MALRVKGVSLVISRLRIRPLKVFFSDFHKFIVSIKYIFTFTRYSTRRTVNYLSESDYMNKMSNFRTSNITVIVSMVGVTTARATVKPKNRPGPARPGHINFVIGG